MTEDILALIKENVVQGRVTQDDEGLEEGMVGQPGVSELTKKVLALGISAEDIINKGLTEGMNIVGQKFEAKEYYIPDMLASAEAVGAAMEILEPHLAKSGIKTKGKIIMATVKGDLHDIGKNIVSILLRGAGYTVKDLGNDIAPEVIVAAVREEKPQFLGLSALLTSTMIYMRDTIQALTQSGLRDKVKVIIGGAAVSEEFAQSIGADGYGADGFEAVRVVESLGSSEED
ncbi:corrinoid protein [Dehalococcoidales bacterium]|nr:corrinoid protein [Dehalococcoidales bacterium]MCL0094577.1 corrinoid protein [Dehalococcoidales bacterium]